MSILWRGRRSRLLHLAAICTLGSAAIHLAAAPAHFEEWAAYGLFFLAAAAGQAAYAAALLTGRSWRTHPTFLALGLGLNAGLLCVYLLSRTVGVPLGPHAGHAEPVGWLDLWAKAYEAAALLILARQWLRVRRRLAPRRRITLVPALRACLAAAFLLAACASASLPGTPAAPGLTPSPYAHGSGPDGHQGDEGQVLGGADPESVSAGAQCPAGAPVRQYAVAAINVEITLNRYLDYDPQGRMYVLEEDLARVRAEESQNRAARSGQAEPAVSIGLHGDAIQPLILRVNQGECLRIRLRNALEHGEPASLHVHGSSLYVEPGGAPALAANAEAIAGPGQSVDYAWWVAETEPEGTHYFHSHGSSREQTVHGLFGAVIVEPKGAFYLDPLTGGPLRSGWSAIIVDPAGSDFRELAIVYHEVGNERYRLLNGQGRPIPQVDPYTDAYRPAARAINYRAEPFMNRLALQQERTGRFDKSQAYSSYVFGDPATPIARSYLGDPVKQRVIHGGSEVFHVHHVHGGAIRWRRQPLTEPAGFDTGLDKHPPVVPQASERTDSQSLGPSETYDLVNECGSGGCQQSAGDFLVHCHVAHHYLAGMWMLWRVYATLQDGTAALDLLPPLMELPDRGGLMQAAVTSPDLIGRTVDWKGQSFQITRDNLAEWVERQLPPRGQPEGEDASVMDWIREGDLYLNEPDSAAAWPGYTPDTPGVRPPIYFDPATGKLAYPFLRPHLGRRPPFAPNHGPAPFLDPISAGPEPAPPGANGPWSLCPAGARLKPFSIVAINLPVALNAEHNIVDPAGAIYVLQEDEVAVRADPARQVPLAIRANAGQDCIDVVFKSKLEDSRENAFFSKANVHIHFVQFDVQASDGVSAGFNYEQSVRPFTVEGEAVRSGSAPGATRVTLGSAARFQPGAVVGVGMDQAQTFETRRIAAIEGDTLVFDQPLAYAHAAGEIVSTEFVRYRWYPDVQFGTAYFHDHVDALHTWRHGLFGALIAEPPGSTYHDPRTGQEIDSGPVADIRTEGRLSAGIAGSFRELVLFVQDGNLLTRLASSAGSSFNLRVEPLARRGGDPARLFSSALHGDPATPVLDTFVGDPVVFRGLVAGTNDVHTLHVDGHWFRVEPWSTTSPPVNTVHIGISERYDLAIPRAGGPQNLPGDYLYYNGRASQLAEGSWGLLRVHAGSAAAGLEALPGREPEGAAAPSVCPAGAPAKSFAVTAIDLPLPMLAGGPGKVFALAEDLPALRSGERPPEPLVLHVNVGDCVRIDLTNQTTGGPVSLHADMLAYDPLTSGGIEAGYNPAQSAAPGETYAYEFYASPEVGETAALVRDWGDVLANPRLGLYGAIVVGPPGAAYHDPVTGADVSLKSAWRVDVRPPSGPAYRDFTLFIQDEDTVIGTASMPYTEQVQGVAGLNYRLAPLAPRLAAIGDPALVYQSRVHGDPSTPLLEAFAGEAVRIHVLVPFGEQAHVFSLEGHHWPLEPGRAGSSLVSSVQAGPTEVITLSPLGGAGGLAQQPGDYVYGDHREPYREAGLWGLLRVYEPGDPLAGLLPLWR